MVAQSQRPRSFDAEQLGLPRFESFSPSLKTQMGKKFSFVFFSDIQETIRQEKKLIPGERNVQEKFACLRRNAHYVTTGGEF